MIRDARYEERRAKQCSNQEYRTRKAYLQTKDAPVVKDDDIQFDQLHKFFITVGQFKNLKHYAHQWGRGAAWWDSPGGQK